MRRLRTPLLLVWLTALWLLLWADLSVANVVSGIGVAAVVLVATGTRLVVHPDIRPMPNHAGSLESAA